MGIYSIYKLIIAASLMGSVAAVIVLLVKAVFKNKLSANFHYYICFLVILRLAMPYMPNSSFSVFNLFNSQPKQVVINKNAVIKSNMISQIAANANNAINVTNKNEIQKNSSLSTNSTPGTNSIGIFSSQNFSFLWILGVSIFLMYVFISYFIFMYKISKERLCADEDIMKISESCRKSLNIKQRVKIIDSMLVKAPTLVGFIRPKILVPHNIINQFTEEEMKYIFIHEFVHLKRKDILLNWINTFVLAIHWFNPVVWLIFMRIKKDCEISCDEMTLKRINRDEYNRYGETLIKLAGIFSKGSFMINSVAIVNKSEIKRRIIMISKYKKKPLIWTIIAVMVFSLAACSSLTNSKSSNKNNSKNTINAANTLKAANKYKFAIYLLKDLSSHDAAQTNLDKLPLENEPIVTEKDISKYYWKCNIFKTDVSTADKLTNSAKPFVLVANGKRIYLGTLWSPFFSMNAPEQPHFTILGYNELLELKNAGYNITSENSGEVYVEISRPYNGKDTRNDKRIYTALKEAGILEE
ncbi:MAG: M56 family metallopeptidase [Bacillota bacterium]|nr:M56 family metallopeptidase [Bacillota bacterium]